MSRLLLMGPRSLCERPHTRLPVILAPIDFQDNGDVVWRLVWAAKRRMWKSECTDTVDTLQASSWSKGTMGTYSTHFRKLSLWVGYTPVDRLEPEACKYIYCLWGKKFSRSYPKGAVSALRALEDMGWVPAFVPKRVWRCAKWSSPPEVCRPYAGLGELRLFAHTCGSRAQWSAYALAYLSFACLLRVGWGVPA